MDYKAPVTPNPARLPARLALGKAYARLALEEKLVLCDITIKRRRRQTTLFIHEPRPENRDFAAPQWG